MECLIMISEKRNTKNYLYYFLCLNFYQYNQPEFQDSKQKRIEPFFVNIVSGTNMSILKNSLRQ